MSADNCEVCAKRTAEAVAAGKFGYFLCDACYKREECGSTITGPMTREQLETIQHCMAFAYDHGQITVEEQRDANDALEALFSKANDAT